MHYNFSQKHIMHFSSKSVITSTLKFIRFLCAYISAIFYNCNKVCLPHRSTLCTNKTAYHICNLKLSSARNYTWSSPKILIEFYFLFALLLSYFYPFLNLVHTHHTHTTHIILPQLILRLSFHNKLPIQLILIQTPHSLFLTLSKSSTTSRPPSNDSVVPSGAFSTKFVIYLKL